MIVTSYRVAAAYMRNELTNNVCFVLLYYMQIAIRYVWSRRSSSMGINAKASCYSISGLYRGPDLDLCLGLCRDLYPCLGLCPSYCCNRSGKVKGR